MELEILRYFAHTAILRGSSLKASSTNKLPKLETGKTKKFALFDSFPVYTNNVVKRSLKNCLGL